jgi:molybdopterin-containing oxidoreductase family membrane subunit
VRKYKGPNILAVFSAQDLLLKGIHELKRSGYENFLVYSPVPHHDIEHALHRPKSPVRVFTLIGGLAGFVTGWALTIGSALHYPLIVGGKPIVSLPPFGVLAYILTILFGALATMIGFLLNARLPQLRLTPSYDERLSGDHYGIQVFGADETLKKWEKVMRRIGAVHVKVAGVEGEREKTLGKGAH